MKIYKVHNTEIENKFIKSIKLTKRYGNAEDVEFLIKKFKKMKRYLKSKKKKIISISNV